MTPEDLSVDPDLIPYLFAARTPAEPEDNDNPTGEPLDPENGAASRKGPVDRFGVSLSPEQRELVDEVRERQRPTSTLANSHRIESLVSLCSIPKSIVTHHLTDPTSRLISIQ